MAPSNGCALCERKESSRWHKNTETGERDICAAATKINVLEMHHQRVCSVREEGEFVGTKIQRRAKEIFVRATKSTCCRNGTIERCALCERKESSRK